VSLAQQLSGSRNDFAGCFRMLQFTFRIVSNQYDLWSLIERYLEPFHTDPQPDLSTYAVFVRRTRTQPYVLERDHEGILTSMTPGGVVIRLLWELNREAIQQSDGLVLVHAAAASWGQHGIVLPAQMGSGKTTLVAGLVAAGFDYLTDEAAVIDPETRMLAPYPKSLSMEPGSIAAIPGLERTLPPQFEWGSRLDYPVRAIDLRPGSVGSACRLRLLISPFYEPEGSTTLEPLSRAAGLLTLAENCFTMNRGSGKSLHILAGALEGVSCYRLRMSDLDTAVGIVGELVKEDSFVRSSRDGDLESGEAHGA
jgi:hypothetical protein